MALDVAYSIVQVARHMEKYDELNSACTIIFKYNNIIEKSILLTPIKAGINVNYKSLEFKCLSLNEYEIVMKYLLDNIYIESKDEFNWMIEWENYIPDMDTNFVNEYRYTIIKNNLPIFNNSFTCNYKYLYTEHFLPLYFISKSQA